MRYAEAYVANLTDDSVFASDARQQCALHGLFYTSCQSAFYIMCFRGVDVVKYMGSHDMDYDLNSERWSQLCSHSLNPLKYCLESVRLEFVRISGLFEPCWIEQETLSKLTNSMKETQTRRKRVSLISTAATLEKERIRGGVGGLGRGTNPLDSFFPFDPYLLMRSHDLIEAFYRHWDGGATADDLDKDHQDSGQELEDDLTVENDDENHLEQ